MLAYITGGASCGKSTAAEELCLTLGEPRVYLAAMRPFGEEGARRVRKHRAQRAGKGFRTLECYEGFDAVLADEGLADATVLLECLGNVVANELFSEEGSEPGVVEGVESGVPAQAPSACARIVGNLEALADRCAHLVVVGNEVGADGVEYEVETRHYQQVLGDVACALTQHCDLVVESVAGVPVVLKTTADAASHDEVKELVDAWKSGPGCQPVTLPLGSHSANAQEEMR